jgi:hypothetical protein
MFTNNKEFYEFYIGRGWDCWNAGHLADFANDFASDGGGDDLLKIERFFRLGMSVQTITTNDPEVIRRRQEATRRQLMAIPKPVRYISVIKRLRMSKSDFKSWAGTHLLRIRESGPELVCISGDGPSQIYRLTPSVYQKLLRWIKSAKTAA